MPGVIQDRSKVVRFSQGHFDLKIGEKVNVSYVVIIVSPLFNGPFS